MPSAYLQGVLGRSLTNRRGFLASALLLSIGGLLAAPGASEAGCGLFGKAKARRAARAMASACVPQVQYTQMMGRAVRVDRYSYTQVQALTNCQSLTQGFGASACASGQCQAR